MSICLLLGNILEKEVKLMNKYGDTLSVTKTDNNGYLIEYNEVIANKTHVSLDTEGLFKFLLQIFEGRSEMWQDKGYGRVIIQREKPTTITLGIETLTDYLNTKEGQDVILEVIKRNPKLKELA